MDEDLRQELEWLNENLKAVVMDLNAVCLELKEIEEKIEGKKIDSM